MGERYQCLIAGYKVDFDFKPDAHDVVRWLVSSFSIDAPCGAELLRLISDEIGCRPSDLLRDPRPWIRPFVRRRTARDTEPEAPPTLAEVRRWHRQLLRDDDALAYLRGRGLNRRTAKQYLLGRGRFHGRASAFMFPCLSDDPFAPEDAIVNLKERSWPDPWAYDAKGKPVYKHSLQNRPACLYPDEPDGDCVVVVEGEFDALLARQHGLPAVTSTAGTSWNADWNRLITDRHVAVIYDVGALTKAETRGREFVAAGAEVVKVIDLARAGLGDKEDLTDWFVQYGRTERDLLRLIRSTRAVRP